MIEGYPHFRKPLNGNCEPSNPAKLRTSPENLTISPSNKSVSHLTEGHLMEILSHLIPSKPIKPWKPWSKHVKIVTIEPTIQLLSRWIQRHGVADFRVMFLAVAATGAPSRKIQDRFKGNMWRKGQFLHWHEGVSFRFSLQPSLGSSDVCVGVSDMLMWYMCKCTHRIWTCTQT